MRNLPLSLLLLALLWLGNASAQTPQGTSFTYQGVLKQNGNALNGNTDMVFDLFDAAVGGNQVGPTLPFTSGNGNPVNVVNGVFDVTLDFGPIAFMTPITDQRFLRVTVNGTALAPRTQIQSEPYALQSQTAELAYSVSNASIGTAQIVATQVQRRVGGTCASGSAISSVNQDGTVACQTAGQGTITGVTAGSGLAGGGTGGAVQLSADTTVLQARVTGSCSAGKTISAVAADGTVTCQQGSSGTISGVTAGNGLTGGGTSGSVGLGITDPLLLSGNDADYVFKAFNFGASGAAVGAESTNGQGVSAYGGYAGVNAQGATYGLYAASQAGTAVNAYSSTGTGVAAAGKTGVAGTSSDNSGYAVSGINYGTAGVGVYGSGQATGVQGDSDTYGVVGNGSSAGVYASASAPTGWGVFGINNATSNGIGVMGTANGNSSTGVEGHTDVGWGVYGTTGSVNGYGVIGVNSATGGTGIYGKGQGASAKGVWGDTDSGNGVRGSASTSGNGVYGTAAGSGTGVYGTSVSNNGVYGSGTTGVYGTGTTYGVYANGTTAVYANVSAATTNGFGVYAYSHATSGTSNGVYGQSDSPGGVGVSGYSGSGIGVAGSSVSGLAGKFNGNVSVTGTLSKGAGSFKIDHPLDPENKYLYHSFVESPDMKNIYDGVAMLDGSGNAWVELPDYFDALNRDFRYQLTALGRPAPSLYVADEIAGNRFRIAGGMPGQRVSWQVTGTRHDAFANANRIPVEVDKTKAERGKYLHPAAFGKPAAQAIEPVPAQPVKTDPHATAPAGQRQ